MRKLHLKLLPVLFGIMLLASQAFAVTNVGSSVFPSTTVRGGTVVFHTGVTNTSASGEAVSISITVSNPGGCVTSALPSRVATILLGLKARETRLATVSQTIPADACAGTYTVTTLVKNALGVVVAKHTTTFTINPAPTL